MLLYFWNRGSSLVGPKIFGTEEVINHDAITKKRENLKTPGVPEGSYGPVRAGAGAGGHLGGGASIRSSPDG